MWNRNKSNIIANNYYLLKRLLNFSHFLICSHSENKFCLIYESFDNIHSFSP